MLTLVPQKPGMNKTKSGLNAMKPKDTNKIKNKWDYISNYICHFGFSYVCTIKRSIPTGGVIKPIIAFATTTIPK